MFGGSGSMASTLRSHSHSTLSLLSLSLSLSKCILPSFSAYLIVIVVFIITIIHRLCMLRCMVWHMPFTSSHRSFIQFCVVSFWEKTLQRVRETTTTTTTTATTMFSIQYDLRMDWIDLVATDPIKSRWTFTFSFSLSIACYSSFFDLVHLFVIANATFSYSYIKDVCACYLLFKWFFFLFSF